MRQAALFFAILLTSASIAADQLAEKWQKRINDAEANFTAAVAKADNVLFFAVQKANTDRLKVLKAALSDSTKAGDFDAGVALREKITAAEKFIFPDPADANGTTPVFLAALYGVNQSWLDVTDKLNALAHTKKGIHFVVSDAELGDPAPEFNGGNTLVTRYALKGKVHTKAVYVGSEFSLP